VGKERVFEKNKESHQGRGKTGQHLRQDNWGEGKSNENFVKKNAEKLEIVQGLLRWGRGLGKKKTPRG